MSDLVEVLNRIAIALETIAGKSQQKDTEPRHVETTTTPFPWHRVSARCRNAIKRSISSNSCKEFSMEDWPLTCEDLMGHTGDQWNYGRGFGLVSAREVSDVLDELGFKNWLPTDH